MLPNRAKVGKLLSSGAVEIDSALSLLQATTVGHTTTIAVHYHVTSLAVILALFLEVW